VTEETMTLPLSDLKQVWVHPPSRDPSTPHALYYGVFVQQCYYLMDANHVAWAVQHGGSPNEYLNKAGEWEDDTMPSEREADFYDRCRWSDFGEAIAAAQKAVEKAKGGE